MKNLFLQSIIRHLLTSAGGALVGVGFMSTSEWETIGGALALLAGLVMSWFDKKKRT